MMYQDLPTGAFWWFLGISKPPKSTCWKALVYEALVSSFGVRVVLGSCRSVSKQRPECLNPSPVRNRIIHGL